MKFYLAAGFILLTLSVQAQKPVPKKTTTPTKPAVAANPLKTTNDSVSYAIGLMVANFYKQQGIKNLNSNQVAAACRDIFSNKKTLLTEAQANLTLMKFLNPKLATTISEGETFLASNKKKAGVKTTASGLQYEVVTEGKGPKPGATDTVTVNYAGTFINGQPFDKNNGISFPLNGVISGWTEGLQLMAVGSKYKFYVPYQLAYGMNDNGPIPGGSMLVFEVELLGIKGK
jgi:FKBP-type peptidyl-prolyl cis-trans isomerase